VVAVPLFPLLLPAGVEAALIVTFSAHSLLVNKRRQLIDGKFPWLLGFGAAVRAAVEYGDIS
jgi:hypothetical protein